jgi:uncharacterized protein (DUF924 family)
MNYQDILDFWYAPETQPHWFAQSSEFDQTLTEKFAQIHQQAALGELWTWRQQPEGRLAEVIILDQFSRNIFRDQATAFAQDALALGLAQEAILGQHHLQLNPEQRYFLYMPFMHSESKRVHEFGLRLFEQFAHPIALEFERKHKAIIDQFGRYPHRNQVLGRTSTVEELAFLAQPNSHF